MAFYTLKIVDKAVANKVNLNSLDEAFSNLSVPSKLQGFEKITVFIVAQDLNDYELEAWPKGNKFYITIPLLYEEVTIRSEKEVTELCLEQLQVALDQLEGDLVNT